MRVEETNAEALRAKRAAVELGYMPDPFIAHLAPRPAKGDFIMNRGYWSRSVVFRALLAAFEAAGGEQALSLGCGLDTLAFKALQGGAGRLRFFECDLAEVVAQKTALIRAAPELLARVEAVAGAAEFPAEGVRCEQYCLFAADLNRPEELAARFDAAGLRRELPTLVVAECVLVYLLPQAVPALRAQLCAHFPRLCLADYEMLGTASPFSRMMQRNFAQRGIPLLALEHFADAEGIRRGHAEAGFRETEVASMREVYERWLNPAEVRRVAGLEPADEFEELNLMQEHYFVSVAVTAREGSLAPLGLAALAGFVER